MGASKACLGYPSRTAFIAAQRQRGMSTRDIAACIGIEPKTVTALEKSASVVKRSPCRRPRGRANLDTKVMDLWDRGMSKRLIASQLDISVGTVEKIMGHMRVGAADVAFGKKAIASGSAALIAAIRLHHPERCSA